MSSRTPASKDKNPQGRQQLFKSAASIIEEAMDLVRESELIMARDKFRNAFLKYTLLNEGIHHISMVPLHEILGHIELKLGCAEKAKMHMLTAQRICEMQLELGDTDIQKEKFKDAFTKTKSRIKRELDMVEIVMKENRENSLYPIDVNIINSIYDDTKRYRELIFDENVTKKKTKTVLEDSTIHDVKAGTTSNCKPCIQDKRAIHEKTAPLLNELCVLPDDAPPSPFQPTIGAQTGIKPSVMKFSDAQASNDAPLPPVYVADAAMKREQKEASKMQVGPIRHVNAPETTYGENGAPIPTHSHYGSALLKSKRSLPRNQAQNRTLETIDDNNEAPVPAHFHQSKAEAAKLLAIPKPNQLPQDRTDAVLDSNDVGEGEHNRTSIKAIISQPSDISLDFNRSSVKSKNSSNYRASAVEEGLAVASPVKESQRTIYEATEYEGESSSHPSFYKSKRCRACTAISLLFIGAIIAVGVVFGSRKQIGLTTQPTVRPTSYRELLIRETLEDNVLRRNATFRDMKHSDPRYSALDWLVHGDKQGLTANDDNLEQRYILALLAFSFHSDSWECGMWEDSDSCNETDVDSDYSMWLSEADECNWFGVTCNDEGSVEGLDLLSNNLIGEIPPEIGDLRFMKSLSLSENCVYGTIPPEVGKLQSLTNFEASSVPLEGSVPSEIYELSSLMRLMISNNKGKGKIRCFQTDGTFIDVSAPGLEGDIFGPQIAQLSNLREIVIDRNNFNGTISSEIGSLHRLESLTADLNMFSGTLPDQISGLSRLKELSLAENKITGAIPIGIGRMQALERLSLWGLNMNGTIPDSLYNLTNLRKLSLRNNDPGFEGPIKSDIGNLLQLESLVLNDNPLLTGTLPSELGLCQNLNDIQIHNTQLTGTVPQEVCALTEKKLNSEGNTWSISIFKADCDPNNETLPPFIVCDCCSSCCDHTTKVCLDRN